MALITISGFEFGTVTDIGNNAISGTASYNTGTVRTGTYSFRANPSTTAVGSVDILSQIENTNGSLSSFDLADLWTEFQFRVATVPASASEPFIQIQTSGSVLKLEARVVFVSSSTFNLAIHDQTGTVVATGASVLSTNTWYRIGIRSGTGANSDYALEIDGVSELSGTCDQTASNNGRIKIGKVANRNGQTVDFFYDDLILNSTTFIGDVQIVSAGASADGSTQQWINGSGGAGTGNYEEVDEIPPNDADYVDSVAQNDVALFAMPDASSMGVSGTIHAASAHIRVFEATDPAVVVVRLRSGGTNSDSATHNLGGLVSNKNRLLVLDPATTAAWTTSGIDGIEVGCVQSNTGTARLYFAGLTVAFTPDVAPTNDALIVFRRA